MFDFLKRKKETVEDSINDTNKNYESTFLEDNTNNLKDLLTNDYVDFSESPKHYAIGEKYGKGMYTGILPGSVNFPTLYDDLYTYGDIDISHYIEPVDNEEALAALSKARTNYEMEVETATGNNRRDDMIAKANECKRLREECRDGYNKLYEVATLFSVTSPTLKDLENDCAKLRQKMNSREINIKSSTYEQEKNYISNKPLFNNLINEYHTFDKRALACTFPFTTSNINHKFGVPIGVNMDNGYPVLFDNFDSKLDNYNGVVVAKSGGGKSTLIKMLASRGATFDDIMNISIDIEPEYDEIADILGGLTIKIAPRSNTIINFFDVQTEFIENKLNGKTIEVVNLEEKLDSVTDIILTMAKGFTGSNLEYYNDITRQIIKDCVRDVYEEKRISEDINSLYTYVEDSIGEDGQLTGGYIRKEMPTLSDWYKALENRANNNSTNTYRKYYDYLLMVMKEYTNYTNGGFTCFDGQSTVEVTTDIPFINFNVSALNEETQLPLAQHIITDYIWENLIKKNDKGKKIRMIIDEAWRMAKVINGVPKYPEALLFLEKLFRRARKKNTAAYIITQQFNEFYTEQTQSIIRNADIKVFLPPDETSVKEIQEVFMLSQGETEFLSATKRGEALFKCGGNSCKLKIEIPEFELDFVQTNQNAIAIA